MPKKNSFKVYIFFLAYFRSKNQQVLKYNTLKQLQLSYNLYDLWSAQYPSEGPDEFIYRFLKNINFVTNYLTTWALFFHKSIKLSYLH